MAFAETSGIDRRVLEGSCPVKITLSEDVRAGDPLGISGGTWVLSAHATAEEPELIAGEHGISGQKITAYPMAVVEVVTTAANVATLGEVVAVHDSGYYVAAGGGLPDVGYISSIGSDNLTAVLFLYPGVVLIDTERS